MNIENNDAPTTYQPTPYQQPAYSQVGLPLPPQAAEPEKRKRKPKWFLPAGLAVAGLVLGFGAGVGAKPEPEIVVQEKIVEKEVEVVKEVTPPSCIEALDVTQEAIELFSTYPEMAHDAVQAAGTFDTAGLQAVTRKIETFNSDLDKLTPKVGAPVAACRLAAE
ncbi:hypothetical protein [Arthrobacter sp. ZGTC131]|uniref:hypothetical protein n=1 Tax=Arthrobacter sp. ZGTC131 TaxID=2058898 RepID=UPI000CE2C8C3|nr:hypothetical protein [Arthrobacter sp. ZGTC131]